MTSTAALGKLQQHKTVTWGQGNPARKKAAYADPLQQGELRCQRIFCTSSSFLLLVWNTVGKLSWSAVFLGLLSQKHGKYLQQGWVLKFVP